MEAQKCFADDDFIAVTQCLALSRRQPLATIDERTVCRSEILKKVLAVAEGDACVTSRDLCFGIVRVEIDVGEDPAIGVPASDLSFDITQHKLLSGRAALFDNQAGMRFGSCAYRRITETGRDSRRHQFRLRSRRRSMVAVAVIVTAVRGSLLHGIGTAIRSQWRTTFIAILRAIEIFCFAPVARNHRLRKSKSF